VPTFRKPRGSYVRDTGDWFSDKLMAGAVSFAALPGLYNNLYLYNDSDAGHVIQLLSITGWIESSAANLDVLTVLGQIGAAAPVPAAPLDPFNPQRAGALYATASAAYQGAGSFLELGGGAAPFIYTPHHPILILPAGYSGLFACDTPSLPMYVSLCWVVLPQG